MSRLLRLAIAALVVVAGACGDDDGGEGSAAQRPHIGFLSASSSPAFVDALTEGLRDLGYADGTTIELDLRPTDDEAELPAIAAALVEADVDLIIAGGTRAVEAAKKATSTIPIVMTNSGDPVGTGLVASLARPGSNVTGLTQISPQLAPKRLELLKEAFPAARKISALLNPAHPATKLSIDELRANAPALGIELAVIEVADAAAVPSALAMAKRDGAGALIVLRDPFTVNAAKDIVGAANDAGLPAIYETTNFLAAGGLMLYGPDFADLYRRSARYVGRILKGADPATLAVEEPTEFELVINPATVAQLKVALPESVRVRATEYRP